MLAISRSDVVAKPFPHVIKQDILPPDVFAALRADFPDTSIFEDQVSLNGKVGSRTGSGFDLYRGDPSYEALLQRSNAWRTFDGHINSQRFLDTFCEVFADSLDAIGLQIDVKRSTVAHDYFEPRTNLTETATVGDRLHGLAKTLATPILGRQRPEPATMFTRLDIHKSVGGYAKLPHCDRPNRLCSLIIYFTDAEATGLAGGDLLIFKHKQEKPVEDYERHPRPTSVEQVVQLRPKPNLGVFFPCQNNSYHAVTEITSKDVERDFLYINMTGRRRSLW